MDNPVRDIKTCVGCPFVRTLHIPPSNQKIKKTNHGYCAHLLIAGTLRPVDCTPETMKVEFEALPPAVKKMWTTKKK